MCVYGPLQLLGVVAGSLALISTHHHQSLLLPPTLAPGWLGGNMLYGQCRSKRTMDSGEKREKRKKTGTTPPPHPHHPADLLLKPIGLWMMPLFLSFFFFSLLHCNSPIFLSLYTQSHTKSLKNSTPKY